MSSTLRSLGFGLLVAFTGFGALFVAGYTLEDPGGWRGVGLVALWTVPMVALSGLAWRRPAIAVPVLTFVAAAIVVIAVWYVIDPAGWRAWEDHTGPVRGIVSLAAVAPMAVLGLKRTATAGWLLLVVGAIPPALAMLSVGEVGWRYVVGSALITSVPAVTSAILYLASAATEDRGAPIGSSGPQATPV